MLLVTGGAGFIGSNVVASLNEAGRADIAVNDNLGTDGKWRNLQKRQLADFVAAAPICRAGSTGRKLDAVIHMGAISETTATDGDSGDRNQFPPARCGCSTGARRRARRSSMRPRPRPMATARTASPTTMRWRR